jgi:hypothetical protein
MISLSLVAVPVFLDTATQAEHLVQQWRRTYHYGHQVLPTMAVATFALYVLIAKRSRAVGMPWALPALAGVVTIAMVPFTWLIMVPTNNVLFQMEADREAGSMVATMEGTRQIVTFWAALHLARSIFPLTGAIIGAKCIFSRFKA